MDNEVELYFFLERLPNKMRVPSKLKMIRDQKLRSMVGDPQMLLFFQYKPQQVSYISQGLKMYTLPIILCPTLSICLQIFIFR